MADTNGPNRSVRGHGLKSTARARVRKRLHGGGLVLGTRWWVGGERDRDVVRPYNAYIHLQTLPPGMYQVRGGGGSERARVSCVRACVHISGRQRLVGV